LFTKKASLWIPTACSTIFWWTATLHTTLDVIRSQHGLKESKVLWFFVLLKGKMNKGDIFPRDLGDDSKAILSQDDDNCTRDEKKQENVVHHDHDYSLLVVLVLMRS
jgi:hypothetical protein